MDDAAIYAKFADELVRFATVLVGPSAAPDVVSEAVIRAFAAPAWPTVTQHRSYLYQSTINQARQWNRTNRRRQARELRSLSLGFGAEYQPIRVEVVEAMRLLTSRQRAVIYLTYWDDLEASEVGDLLKISIRTVQRELTAARQHLEDLLA